MENDILKGFKETPEIKEMFRVMDDKENRANFIKDYVEICRKYKLEIGLRESYGDDGLTIDYFPDDTEKTQLEDDLIYAKKLK